ncbi:hypothetical protein HNR19_004019 [Nocardioides thalensis]|uniref:Uncharacterized protein n=1 Tax=Nocardioides thalensis TaxID=1914755 RepID=A0A853C838_9ACTN|nr:hypothetical protein [Nocardioides thalensis]NYJ03321.1 hypothetical protein [Nocardioides thalensis]
MTRTEARAADAALARGAGPVAVRPGRLVVTVGVVTALWCLGFAAFNVWFEATDRFSTGEYADAEDALSVMNWVVTVLKLVGAGAALLSIRRRPVAPRSVGVVLWGAFATVTVYVVGSIAFVVAILAGVAGDVDTLDGRSIAYVAAFLLAAAGFGILAASFQRRARPGARTVLLGICGAPVVLGGVLVVGPAILEAAGLMSAR